MDNTQRKHLPACSKSKASLICSNFMRCVMYLSRFALSPPDMTFSTSFGTATRLLYPPKAVPYQVRPVTSWNGLVEISVPAAATPTMTDVPQPFLQHSSALRMTLTLPTHSKE